MTKISLSPHCTTHSALWSTAFFEFSDGVYGEIFGAHFCTNAVTQIISFITFIAILFNRPLSGHFEKHKKRRLRIIGVKLTYVLNPRKWNFNSIYIESSDKGAGNKV